MQYKSETCTSQCQLNSSLQEWIKLYFLYNFVSQLRLYTTYIRKDFSQNSSVNCCRLESSKKSSKLFWMPDGSIAGISYIRLKNWNKCQLSIERSSPPIWDISFWSAKHYIRSEQKYSYLVRKSHSTMYSIFDHYLKCFIAYMKYNVLCACQPGCAFPNIDLFVKRYQRYVTLFALEFSWRDLNRNICLLYTSPEPTRP